MDIYLFCYFAMFSSEAHLYLTLFKLVSSVNQGHAKNLPQNIMSIHGEQIRFDEIERLDEH